MKHNMWNKIVRYFACALAVFSAVGCEKMQISSSMYIPYRK